MAYSAVTSLKHTIHRLLNSRRISVAASTQETLEFADEHVESLQETLEMFDGIKNSSEGVMAVDAQIRDAARKLEDEIESQASAQFLLQSQSHEGCPPTLFLNLDELRQEIDRFVETAAKMKDEYVDELGKPEDAVAGAVADSSVNDSGGNMVGLSDQFLAMKNAVVIDNRERITLSISGMAGIGKTTLARKVFDDVKQNFECRVFVRIGQKYQFEEILRAIIAQINLDNDARMTVVEEEEEDDEVLYEYFKRSLSGRKYFIVLDDVWDVGFFIDFHVLLPEEDNGSRILVTTRENEVAKSVGDYAWLMRFLNLEESWELLRKMVFGEEEYCSYQLEKAGKKIAENCEGLPLLILKVAEHLSGARKDPEYWEEVAKKQNSVFEDSYDQMSEVLLPSYYYLVQKLKACFLYMGAFPQDYIVRRSKIVNLWRAEGFLKLVNYENTIGSIFDKFVSSNLVVIRQRSSATGRTKACSLHSAYRHLSKREAENSKFLFILNSYATESDGLFFKCMKNKRHLAIYHNTLLAIEEVHSSIASSVSTLRSVLCTGPYHQYQVSICSFFILLRVLDVVSIRFYEFPIDEVVKLVLLRYLAFTCNANLPRTISKLWNLQTLIVHQHASIRKLVVDESYVPVEIWDLQELKYLQIVGRNLPEPPPGAVLPNLSKLLDVGVQTCVKKVLQSIPRLKKLRIRIELAPHATQTLSCFDHITCLHELKSLQSFIVNTKLLCEPIVPPLPISASTYTIKKLTLSGFGYPWEDMNKIGKLSNLEVLKLQCFAFRGEKWEANGKGFSKLMYILIDDTDLVQWTAGDETFPDLEYITMKNCHRLQVIPQLQSSIEIELVDCNPQAEICARQMTDNVNVTYSWK